MTTNGLGLKCGATKIREMNREITEAENKDEFDDGFIVLTV